MLISYIGISGEGEGGGGEGEGGGGKGDIGVMVEDVDGEEEGVIVVLVIE